MTRRVRIFIIAQYAVRHQPLHVQVLSERCSVSGDL
jgi:hypothetical protein